MNRKKGERKKGKWERKVVSGKEILQFFQWGALRKLALQNCRKQKE